MKKIFYAVFALAAFSACQSLDQEPATSISAETAIESVQDLSYAVNGAYYQATGRGQLSLVAEMAIYADELGPDATVQNGSGQYAQRIHERSITALDSWDAYAPLYRGIAAINKALQKAEALEDQDGAAPYLAELIGMRGLFHFHLATFFAPIPTSGSSNTMGIVLSTEVYPLDYVAPRASLDDTYDQIVKDLTTYINSGYNKEESDLVHGHLTHWGALALRARAYLYWGKYAEALADAKTVIEQSPYKLYTIDNYTKVWETDGGDEVIMEYAQDDTYNAQRYAPGYYTHPDGYTEYLVTEDFYNFMKSNEKDVRSNLVGYRQGKGPSGPYPLKYPGKKDSAVPLYSHSVKVVRLAEMYLIAAEAALKTSGASAAVPYLNTLRQNRIEDYVDVTTTDIDDILNERRKELFSEGQIAFDFWRNGKSVTSGPATYGPDHFQNVLPIPKDEIDVCGADILKQNPGY